MTRIAVILEKEWKEIRGNRALIWSTLFIAALFTLIPFFLLFVLPNVAGKSIESELEMEDVTARMRELFPELADLKADLLLQILIYRQFLLFLLIVPAMCALSVATYSIVGEKQSRSLEPLLATPIKVAELLIGKSLAAMVPALLLGWMTCAIYALGIRALSPSVVFHQVFNPMGLVLVFVVAPLIALLGLSLGVVVSSRANDPRSAQGIGTLIILPLVILVVAQFAGAFFLTLPWLIVAAVGIALLDAAVLVVGVKLFERETILTRWK